MRTKMGQLLEFDPNRSTAILDMLLAVADEVIE
jgi:hypothetical protein